MKIAIFTDTFMPQLDGVVTATISMAKGLADRGHQVYIIAPKYRRKINEFSYKDVVVKRVASVPAFFYKGYRFTLFWSRSLAKYLRKENIDVIQLQTPVMLGVHALLISRFLKKPIVGTFHTFFTDPQYTRHIGLNSKLIQKLSWAYAKMYYNRCNLVTCPSESAREELAKHGLIEPIKVISNGIDVSKFDNSNWESMKEKFNPSGDIILSVGRIAYEKNLECLLRCFKFVLEQKKNAKLVIVGDGPQMGELKATVKKMNLSESVVLTGIIDHESLVKSGIFKASKVFVTVSTTETQGITTLEAQANGLVCVGVDARGTRDLIKDGYNGYLVAEGNEREFADRVVKLLDDSRTYVVMECNTLKCIKDHDIKDVVGLWEKEYSELITKCLQAK